MTLNATAHHTDEPVKTCPCTTGVQITLPTNLDASTNSRGDLWSLSLALFLASI